MAGWLTDPGPRGTSNNEGKVHAIPAKLPPAEPEACSCKQSPQDCPTSTK